MLTAVLKAGHDVCRTERNTVVYPTVCSLAGLVAGMFGVGGGIVKVSCMRGCDLNNDQEACSLLQGTLGQPSMS